MYCNNAIFSDNTFVFLCNHIEDMINTTLLNLDLIKKQFGNAYKASIAYRDTLLRYKYYLVIKMELNRFHYFRDNVTATLFMNNNLDKNVCDYLDRIRKGGRK